MSQGRDRNGENLVLELGGIANELEPISRAAEYGDPPAPGRLKLDLDEARTAIRKVQR